MDKHSSLSCLFVMIEKCIISILLQDTMRNYLTQNSHLFYSYDEDQVSTLENFFPCH